MKHCIKLSTATNAHHRTRAGIGVTDLVLFYPQFPLDRVVLQHLGATMAEGVRVRVDGGGSEGAC